MLNHIVYVLVYPSALSEALLRIASQKWVPMFRKCSEVGRGVNDSETFDQYIGLSMLILEGANCSAHRLKLPTTMFCLIAVCVVVFRVDELHSPAETLSLQAMVHLRPSRAQWLARPSRTQRTSTRVASVARGTRRPASPS